MDLPRGACAVALAVLLVTVAGCARSGLTWEQVSRLDSLDAPGVVEAYFASGDPDVELYLSSPEQVRLRSQPNFVPEDERSGGVGGLRVSGGNPAELDITGGSGYRDVRRFVVRYVSKRRSSIGEPPGERHWFVYTGMDRKTGHVKVLSVGTGP